MKTGYYYYTYTSKSSLNSVVLNVQFDIENAIKYVDYYNQTDVLYCTGDNAGCPHRTYNCHSDICVQRMKQTNLMSEVRYEDTSVRATSDSNKVKYGNAKILKTDETSSYNLLGGKVQFQVYYTNGGTTYYLTSKSGENATFTTDVNDEDTTLTMGGNGCYEIINLNMANKYYFKETATHNNLYEMLSSPVRLNLTSATRSDKRAAMDATKYLFTRNSVTKGFFEDQSKGNKEEYVEWIYYYIRKSKSNINHEYSSNKEFTDEQLKNEDGKRTEKTRKEYLASLITSSYPTDAEIKAVIDYIFNNYVSDDHITNIMQVDNEKKDETGKEHYVNKVSNSTYLGKDVLMEYQKERTWGYLDKQGLNLIRNKKNTGILTISKTDEDTGTALSGAIFSIRNNKTGSETKVDTSVEIKSGSSSGTIKQVANNNNSNNLNVTYKNGTVTIKDLPYGKYTIEETRAPTAPTVYNLDLQENNYKTKNVTLDKDHVDVDVDFVNKQYGSIQVTKKDADTGLSQLGGISFEGIQFKLYVIKNGQKQYLNGNASSSNTTHYNYSDFNISEQYKAGAKTFTTNANGQFAIQNLPVYEGASIITYYIEEYYIPSVLQDYYDVKGTVDTVTISNGSTTDKTITNKQQYIKISGYVWDDVADESKKTLKNNIYEAPETLVSGITVILRDKDGNIVTKPDGTKQVVTTDANGNYQFGKVKIENLKNYYIEFEYNGLKYQSVTPGANNWATNSSKASEKAADRTSFNNSYASITGGNVKGDTTTVGSSKDTNGTITNYLTYTNGVTTKGNESIYGSELVQNTEYTVASASGSVSAQNGSVGVTMKADTNTAGYSLNRWSSGTVEITNVNLGITSREQPDMAISTDLNSVDLAINGYSHTYTYNKRLKATGIDIFSEIEKWNKTEEEQVVQAKNGYPRTYTRSIYKNYVYASGITGNGALEDEDKLQVYLTYQIVVKNESSSLYMSANEIVNYYDKTLDLVESWYEDSNGKKINVTWKLGRENNGYNQFRTDSLKDVKIEHGQSVIIYIKTKKNNVISWATKNEINDKTYNVTEIASYSSYTKSGNSYLHYAGIDKDSAPDNIVPGRGQEYVKRYEDDTDAAPVLGTTFKEPKTISGYVFEDVAKYEDGSDETALHTGQERKGDGKYNASQDGYVANVKVELIKIPENETEPDTTAYIYPKAVTNLDFNAEKAENKTNENGKGYYEFVGVIPGEYYLKYTYDDGSVIYKKVERTVNVTTQDYKSTIITSDTIKTAYGNNEFKVDGNLQWYQDETIKGYSAAVDDYKTRTTINDALNEITYKVRTGYEDKEGNYADLQTMTARTPNMSIAIENTDNEITDGIDDEGKRISLYDNINFGIIERPRKSLKTTKEIKYIRLILANKHVLAEGDPRTDSINYVTYPEGGNVKIEVDNELIEGATLEVTYEIKIENKSELDYDTQIYYKYGEVAEAEPVALKIDSVIDHMDEELTTEYTYNNSSGWTTKKAEELNNEGKISSNVYNSIKYNHNTLVNDKCNNLELSPIDGKNIGTIDVKASKLLSTSKEMLYKNYAEVLVASNSVGRFYGQISEDTGNKWRLTTPGNFVPNPPDPTPPPEDDGDEVTITIIPPTGENKDIIIYSVVGISCLIILTGGIILIKKKVLD